MDDEHWDHLIELVEGGRVIPIVGPGLLRVTDGTGDALLHDRLAAHLNELRPPGAPSRTTAAAGPPACSGPDALNRAICRYMAEHRKEHRDAIECLNTALRKMRLEPPEPLKKLAAIRHFNL